jgi:integrase
METAPMANVPIPDYRVDEIGRGTATFDGTDVFFESIAGYDRLLATWLANGRRLPPDDVPARPVGIVPLSWSDFSTEVLALYAPPLRSRRTWEGMRYALRCLGKVGCERTTDLTVSTIAELVKSRPEKNSPNSTRGLLRYCQTASSYAEKMAYVRLSPFKIRGLASWVRAVPAKGKKHCSTAEVKLVLEHMQEQAKADGWNGWKAKRLFCLTSLIALTGMRASEAYWLRVQDVDLELGIIFIRSHAGRHLKTSGAEQPVPVPPGLRTALVEWLKHRVSRPPDMMSRGECNWLFPGVRLAPKAPWWTGDQAARPCGRMQAVAAEVGVLGFGPLALRHSFGTHCLAWGVPAAMRQRIMRHTTSRTAELWYTHSDLPDLRDAASKIGY